MKIHQLVHKILSTNEISTFIKGHNFVENERINIIQIYINVYTKFDRNTINSQDIKNKHNSDVDQGPLLKIDKKKKNALDYGLRYGPPIPRRFARTDGRTLKRFGGYIIIPRHFLCGGV